MTQIKYELASEPEFWELDLKDGSVLKVLADGYSQENHEIVFQIACKGNPSFDIEPLRIPSQALDYDHSHWNGDSYDEYPSILANILTGSTSLAELECWYCHKVGTLHCFMEKSQRAKFNAALWCSFCWHNLEQKVVTPSWWFDSTEVKLRDFQKSPRQIGNFETLVDNHWKLVTLNLQGVK